MFPFTLFGEFYVTRMQAKFCRNCLHHIQSWESVLCVTYTYQQIHVQYVKYYNLFVLSQHSPALCAPEQITGNKSAVDPRIHID